MACYDARMTMLTEEGRSELLRTHAEVAETLAAYRRLLRDRNRLLRHWHSRGVGPTELAHVIGSSRPVVSRIVNGPL